MLALLICCVWTAQAHAYVYWADESGIRRANVDGSSPGDPMLAQRGVGDLARDAEGTNGAYGLAVNDTHIYWTNSGSSTVGRASVDGTGVNQQFIRIRDNPVRLAVDDRHLVWAADSSVGAYGESSIWRANLDGTGATSLLGSLKAPRGVAVDEAPAHVAASASATTLHFGVQPLFTIGAPQSVTIASTGIDRDLVVDQVRLTGDDFVISRDTCTDSTLAVGATCSVAVRFAPGAAGDRHAVLSIAGNAPLEIALDGTAGALPQGPAGPAGAVGAAAVPAVRRLGLVVCRRRCADRAIEGATAFTAAGRATLTRKGKRYATGVSDGAKLVLRARRQVRPGRYTLTLRAPGGITTRGTVRIS